MRCPWPDWRRTCSAVRAAVLTRSEVITSTAGIPKPHGWSLRVTVQGEHSRVSLREKIDARSAGVRSVRAEGRHADPDDVRLVSAHRFVVDAEPRQRRLAGIGNQNIRGGEKTGEDALCRFTLPGPGRDCACCD